MADNTETTTPTIPENHITTSGALFTGQQVKDIFSKVAGHSSIAKLSNQTPIPYAGTDVFIFTMDGEASIVGEGEKKPSGPAKFSKAYVKPVKVLYSHRLTDEFVKLSDEARLPYLQQFYEGFSKKIARAIDIMYVHGLNPATKESAAAVKDICVSSLVTSTVAFEAANADDNIDSAVAAIQEKDGSPTGVMMAPKFAAALGKIKQETGSKLPLYPEFRGVGNPSSFMGLDCDVNSTVAFNDSTTKNDTNIKAVVGDFRNALKWGYCESIPMEIIEYGDPDGLGDLKRHNQIVLRAEAYVGCGIIDPDSFCKVVETVD